MKGQIIVIDLAMRQTTRFQYPKFWCILRISEVTCVQMVTRLAIFQTDVLVHFIHRMCEVSFAPQRR